MNGKNTQHLPLCVRALEERLNRTARESNQDLTRLRRQIAFDRFLARLFSCNYSNRFVLKGGYALELRLHKARTTKDVDICFNDQEGIMAGGEEGIRAIVRQAASVDIGDFFEFLLTLDLSLKSNEYPPELRKCDSAVIVRPI